MRNRVKKLDRGKKILVRKIQVTINYWIRNLNLIPKRLSLSYMRHILPSSKKFNMFRRRVISKS
jgi:hypothetical protein